MELEVFNITDPSVIVCSSNGTINSDDYYEECNNNMHTPSIFFQVVSVVVSAYTMVVISGDRYFAIVYPLRPRMTRRQAKVVMLICWNFALLIALPIALFSQTVQPTEYHETNNLPLCLDIWSNQSHKYYYNLALFGAQYVLPLVIILFSYGRIGFELWGKRVPGEANLNRDRRIAASKRKMIKMMITVVVVFALCWLPLNGFLLMYDLWPSIDSWTGISYAYFICHWTAMSHSSYNPFIYCCFHAGFRQGMTSLAYRMGCRKCFPVAESFDGMDAEMLQRGNTFSSYISRNSSLRFQRGSTLRPLLSSQPTRGSTYNRNSLPAFRTSPRFSESSDIVPVTTETQKESNGVCKIVFRNLSPRRSEGKVELRVFCEKEAV
ncbi:RYamide receptor-like isoform X2 [Artemia franciscana]|uniref:RYamide receptor-like isoform X2 n=1 Tax=Artemia franciscana TaxID=6661 RepID=UPI0032DB3EB7